MATSGRVPGTMSPGCSAVLEVPVATFPQPARIAHGTADAAVPWQLTELTATQLAGAGTDVVFLPVPDVDHLGLPPAAAPPAVDWLDELFASSPAPRPGSGVSSGLSR